MNNKLLIIKKKIENIYSETGYSYFAITKIDFNCNQRKPKLEIEVSHYKSPKKLLFKFHHFLFHIVSDERDMLYFSNKSFEGFSVVFISTKYEIVDLLKQKGFTNYFYITEKNPDDYFIFRVIAQNYFVDILTDQLPEIVY